MFKKSVCLNSKLSQNTEQHVYGFQYLNINYLLKYKLKFLKLILASTLSSQNDTKQRNVHGPFTLIAYMYLLHSTQKSHVHN